MQNLRVELKTEKLLGFQVEASHGQNLQFKQPRKISSRKQHFRTESEGSSLTGLEAGKEGKGASCSVYKQNWR